MLPFVSCEVLDPKEQIPSYIHIDKISLTTDYATQGTTASKFTDAWVYIDDQPLGTYELPATFPVLQEGRHDIKIRGGIKVNGISATRAQYVLCNFNSQNIDLQINNTVNVIPSVTYFPAIKFEWLEDFENIGVSLTKGSTSDTSLLTTNSSEAFEGQKSGAVYLDASHTFFEAVSSVGYNLPVAKDVFLELNYKCNNEFHIGVYASGSTLPYTTIYVNSTNNTWNKIYINMINEVTTAHTAPFFIFISMQKDPGVDLPVLYLDNIKLIHQ